MMISLQLAGTSLLFVGLLCVSFFPLHARDEAKNSTQEFTGYPPTVYMHPFLACPDNTSCSQTNEFNIDEIPSGCCVLVVANGDGRGTDEVHSYEVFLNGERVVSNAHTPGDHATVKLKKTNTLKVVLQGKPDSRILILITYDPRQSK